MCLAPELNGNNLIRSFTPGAKVKILSDHKPSSYL